MRGLRLLFLLLGISLLACPPYGGDADDDDVGDDDDDSTDPLPIVITGEVITRSQESGGILSEEEYQARSGLLVVYMLEDPDDLTNVLWKETLDGPGAFSGVLDPNLGPVYATVIADCDGNSIIEDVDIRRNYPFNPIWSGVTDISDITLEIDIPVNCRGGGGGGDDETPTTTISGPITLVNLPPAPVAVAVTDEYLESTGWWFRYNDAGATDYSITVRDWFGENLAVIGYHETDGNGLYEPSDYTGEVTSNPITIGVGDVTGAELVIPSAVPLDLPQPPGDLTLSGTVEYSAYAGGDILVFVSANDTNGQLLAAQTLAAPGPFSLEVPEGFEGMVLWAVEDPETDGQYSLASDANDTLGPFNVGTEDETGLSLVLEPVPSNVNSLGGTITLGYTAAPNDQLVISLLDDFSPGAPPVAVQYVGNPGATVDYMFVGLGNGQYGISAFVDVDSDSTAGPAAGEPIGGSPTQNLTGGTDIDDNDFSLTVP